MNLSELEDYIDYSKRHREIKLWLDYIESMSIENIDRVDIKDTWRNIGIGTSVLTRYFRGATLAPDNEDARILYARLGGEDYEDDAYNIGYGVYRVGTKI